MKSLFLFPLAFLFFGFFTSCVSPYRSISPQSLSFDDGCDTLLSGDVLISWQYNILYETGNKYYANLEKESQISLVAVWIQNRSVHPFRFPRDVQILAGDEVISPIHPDDIKYYLSQVGTRNPEDSFDLFGDEVEGIVAAAAYTLTSMGLQYDADKSLQKEVRRYYLEDCTVPPGSEKTGLLILPVPQWRSLKFTLMPLP